MGSLAKAVNGGREFHSRQPAEFFTTLHAELYNFSSELSGIKCGLVSIVAFVQRAGSDQPTPASSRHPLASRAPGIS